MLGKALCQLGRLIIDGIVNLSVQHDGHGAGCVCLPRLSPADKERQARYEDVESTSRGYIRRVR